ncbi:hypothetical protein AX777_18285 [Sphingobium yanoikuyae]|uniref:Uncharacterized protein n=1 Tax=Sphingobium yanoikuyae TaxID=13690 RepID=A0A177J7E1_SPHYA|nr:hypothetical protein [Sphingobium yanoikuyae]OAH36988.1 hypothetical protein AX777_18285 [Sphingobium yanoikuyae]
MDLAAAFGEIGMAFSAALGGPYHDARTIEQVAPVYDDGGSIVTPGGVAHRDCQVQIDTAIQRIRDAGSYVDTDLTFIILAATLDGSLNTEARIEVLDGPHAGKWSVDMLERDPVAAGWVGRGRRA